MPLKFRQGDYNSLEHFTFGESPNPHVTIFPRLPSRQEIYALPTVCLLCLSEARLLFDPRFVRPFVRGSRR